MHYRGHYTKRLTDRAPQHTIPKISHQRSTTSISETHAQSLHGHIGVTRAVMVLAEPVCTSLFHEVWLVQVFPMRRKADAHEGLSLLAQHDGGIIMDGSKEQTMELFQKRPKKWASTSSKQSHIPPGRMQPSLASAS